MAAATAAGTYNANLTVTSTGATTTNVALTGVVNANPVLAITNPAAVCSPATVNLTAAAVTAGSTGTFTLTYWTDAAATAALASSNAVATSGTYYIKATTSAGCTDIEPVTVTINAPISAVVIAVDDQPCGNTATGSATVTLTGGVAPFTYAWTRNGTAFTATPANAPTNLTAANAPGYVLTVTDACGSSTSNTITLTNAPTLALNSAVLGSNALCNSGNGAIVGVIQGGSSPRTLTATNTTNNTLVYSSSIPSGTPGPGQFQYTLNVPAGTYSVSASDGLSSCISTSNTPITVTQPAALTSTVSKTDVCFGGTNGTITVTASGGTGTLQYSIDGGTTYQASNSFTGLSANAYSVVVQDANNCTTAPSAVTINQSASALAVAVTSVTNLTCNGVSTGAVNITASGGYSTAYTYSWTGPSSFTATTEDLANRPAGIYNVTVTDAGGCTAQATATLTQPTAVTATVASTNVLCNGGTSGTITVSAATGGVAPYNYSIDGGATFTNTTGLFTGLTAGTYDVRIRDNNSCVIDLDAVANTTISQPNPLTATATFTNVLCNGGTTGTITVAATGGTPAYTYSTNGTTFVSTPTLTGLSAATYTVTVKDANLCQTTVAGVIITQPAALSASISAQTNNTCNGESLGSATVSVTGGTGAFAYSWNTTPVQTTATATTLAAGTYVVSITDAAGCTASATATITQPTAITATVAKTNVLCNGGSTGTISVNGAAGGTAPYQYSINGGSSWQSSNTFSGLTAGTYNVQIKDNGGAQGTPPTPATIATTVTQSYNGRNMTYSNVNLNSSGNSVVVQPGGSVSISYNYAMAYGSLFCPGCVTQSYIGVGGTSTNIQCISPIFASTNGIFNGTFTAPTTPGIYYISQSWSFEFSCQPSWYPAPNSAANAIGVIVVSANSGCIVDLDGVNNTIISQPNALTATAVKTNVACFGAATGTVTATATGGTAPYTYSLNGGTYQSSNVFNTLVAGTYTVTVKDANNCTVSATAVTITQPASALTAGHDGISPASCTNISDGAIPITATGGTAPYSYAWSGPNGFTSSVEDQFYNLSAGTYSVIVTDINACQFTLSNLVITAPAPVALALVSSTNATCYQGTDGAIDVSATGGTTPYGYSWTKDGVNLNLPVSTQDLTNIGAGTYVLTLTDGNFCQQTLPAITITEGPQIVATVASAAAAICSGANAVFTITGTAGHVVTYNLNGGTNATATIAAGGTATVTVTAATTAQTLNLVSVSNGSCSNTLSGTASVTINALPTANAGADQTVCAGAAVTLSGAGTGTYTWNNSVVDGVAFTTVNATLSPITTTYTLTVTNANGCTATDQVNVTVNVSPTLTAVNNQTVCTGAQTTAVTFANNLTGTTYAWTNNTASIGLAASGTGNIAAFTATNTGTASVTATVSVTGTNAGCTSAPTTFTISVNPTPTVNNFTAQTVCAGATNAAVVPTGAVSGTNYAWTNTNTTIGLAASGTGTIPSFTAVNAGATAVTSTVTVTPSYGGPNMGTVFGATNENGSLVFNAPAGTYFTGVQFASYGTPTGTLGNYAIGTCHAANSSTVVSNLAVGQTTVTIPATNAVFGDPCGGVGKALAVVLSYGTYGSACSGTAKTYTITVNPTPVVSNRTTTVCSGSAFTVTPTNGSGNIVPSGTTYTWTVAANANVTGASNQSTATSTISQTLTNTSNTVQTVVYTVTPISGTCSGATFTVTVTVNPTPTVTAQAATICSGNAFSVAPSNGSGNIVPTGTTYSWSAPAAITGISGLAAGTAQATIGGTLTNSTAAPINVTYVVTPSSGSCAGVSFTVVVTVNPRPAITNMTATICSATAFTAAPVNVTNGVVPTGTTYTWTVAANANVTGESAVATASNNISQTLINTTANAEIVTYTVTPTANACAGATFTVAVTVNPLPVIANKTATICSGTAFTVAPVNGTDLVPTGTTYTWTVAANANVTGETNQAVAQSSISQNLVNTTSAVETVVYTVTPTFGGCTGATFTVTVTVNPTPSIITQVTNACSGVAFTLSPTNGAGNIVPNGTTYTWTVVDNPNVVGETNANVAQSNVSQTLVNNYTSSQQIVYTVTPTAGSCIGIPFTYTVTLSTPVSVAAITGATNVCLGSTTQLASATSGGAWTSTNTAVATVSSTGVVTGITTGTTTISYTVTNSVGCIGVVSATINVNTLPTPVITPSGSTTLCDGGSVTLTASTGSSYLWSNGLQTQSITVGNAGNYSVIVTNAAGCSTTSAPVAVIVNALPSATISANGPTTFCQGGSVTLTASSGTSYAWSNGATTQSITVSATGNYSVTVTNSNGCSATSAPVSVTVNTLPIANITSLNGNTFCQGGSVTLVSSAGSSYAWSNGLTTQSINVTASANLTVTVTNANGCSATSAPFGVTMNAAPVATITANGPTTFCQGGQVTLTAPAAAAYQWNSGETTQSIVVNVDGPSTVTITNANGCSATSAITNITVLPIPTVAAIAGSNQLCVGSSINLTNATIGGVWTSTNTTVATVSATGEITALASGTATINYAVTNASGCTTTSSITLNVNALPSVLAIAGANSLCVGSQVVYTNGVTGGTWSSNNVGIATVAQNGVITGVAAGSATISYTITNAAGCSSTVTKVVTVNALPTVAIVANGPLTFCQGGSVTLTASGGTSYAWSNSTVTTPTRTINASGSYTVTATNANGCFATSAPVVVNVLALPNAAITSTGSTICLGSTTTLTASGGVSYAWSNGAQTASTTVNNSNTYTVTVTGANGCTATASNVVTVNANPAVVVTASAPLTFCQGGSVTLNATGAANYVWSEGTIGSSLTVTQTGTYYAQGTNAAGCTSNSAVFTVTVLPTPVVAALTGANSVCEASTIALSSATSGGVWSTSNSFIANVDNAGVITGMNAGTAVITYTLSNGACNSSVSASVTVLNSPATPVITAGGPTTVCPNETVQLFSSNAPNYQWNSGPQTNNILVTQSGSYTVTVVGSNGCAVTSLPMTVTIGDDVAPIIVAPINVNVNPNLGCTAVGVALGTPVVSDNCTVASVTNNAPSLFPIGTTTVTWTVTDASGNTATATQLVNVVDQVAPEATAPADVTINANNFCAATGVNLGTPEATDNCTIASIANDAPASFPIGTTVVTWTITDATGNFTTVTQNVTVIDTEAPVVVLQSAAVQLDANGFGVLSFEAIDNGSSDNCGIATVSIDQTTFDCSQVGFNTVTVTITDNSGNQSEGTVVINVIASDACGSDNIAGPNVPDAFTPNGNSINDTWVIPGLEGYNTKQMAVYSRYGTLVYYSAAYANDWDGTLMGNGVAVPDGTYYYILNLDGGKQMAGYVYINRVKQ